MDFLDIIKSFSDKDISAFNDFKVKIGADLSVPMILLVAFSFGLFVYLSFKSTKELKNKRKRFLLILFRVLALFAILFMIFQPKLELRETKEIKNKMAVLFDDSESMGLKLESGGNSRFENLKSFLKKNDDFFEKLSDDFDIDYYSFGSSLKPTTLPEFLAKGAPEESKTYIGEAIEGLKTINPKAEYKEVLVLTDGCDNGKIKSLTENMSSDLDKSLFKKYVKSLNVKIHPIAITNEKEKFSDIAINKVMADQFGFIRTPFEIEVLLYASGLGKKSIPITLKNGDNIVKALNIKIEEGKKEYKVKMKFYPQKIGRFVYTVSVPTYSDELIQENNEKSFFVNVIRDKTRVLMVVGTPTWDERFLRRTLKNNPNIDLIPFFILRTSYDYLNVPEKEMSLIPFPTREIFDRELHTFDVVILMNFDYGPFVPTSYLQNIKKYVMNDGGGFVMVGGDRSFNAGRYERTPIVDILPVDLSVGMTPFSFGKFKPVLTEVGNAHPILRVDFDAEKNRAIFDSLPALEGINNVLKLKDDALALMTHPKERNEHGPTPIISISEMGKGRSMAITTDTLWKWNLPYVGEGGSTRLYDNFWHNALKWLVKDPALDLVKLTLQENTFSTEESIKIKLKVLDHKYQPTDKARVKGEVKSDDGKVIKLNFRRSETVGDYESEFVPKRDGNYVIETSAYLKEKYLGKDIHPFIVEESKAELINIEVDHDLLAELATLSETKLLKIEDDDISGSLAIDSKKEVQLLGKVELTFWDSKMNFLIITMFLIIEWFIRRKYGLY
ncbi:glutamine amidotransferase [Thermodesulfobacteriota bacterium]